MELNQCINFILTKTQQKVFQHFKAKLNEFDVTPAQYAILSCLWQEDSQTPKQIAACISLDSSTITGILDRMEKKGLVERIPDPNDRRALRVILTKEGSQLREPINKVITEANQHILEVLTKEEQDQFIKFLERIENVKSI